MIVGEISFWEKKKNALKILFSLNYTKKYLVYKISNGCFYMLAIIMSIDKCKMPCSYSFFECRSLSTRARFSIFFSINELKFVKYGRTSVKVEVAQKFVEYDILNRVCKFLDSNF